MSMIACPGCGLPREEQLNNVPCPVCDAGPALPTAPESVAKKPAGRDSTTGLPADISEMNRSAPREGFPAWFSWAAVFVFGIATGVVGFSRWQAANAPVEVAKAEPVNPRPLPTLPPQPPAKRVEPAPIPAEPKPPVEPKPSPEPAPEPSLTEPKGMPVGGERPVTIDLNLPNGTYSIPFAMKKGERIILKGKVHTLRASGLDGGAILDASGLEAAQVYIGGTIDNGSVLKVNAPNGKVTVGGSVLGKSSVEITAPGGDVIFSAPTTPTRPGSAIDSGSIVVITARSAEFLGDINGSNTKVTVNLPRIGMLKVVAIRGTANVEYRVADGKGMPDVSAAFVSPAASFKKID